MRSLRWWFITGGIAAILLAVGIALGSAWLNSFVHSDAFRQEVEKRAGQTLGGPVEIKQVDFSLLGGVKLLGLATKIDSSQIGNQGTLAAQVESVNCSYSWVALLSRRLELDGLTLDKPEIVLTQEPASAVPTPAPPPVPASETTGAETHSSVTINSPVQVVLDAAKINDGSLAIRDATGATKANLQGVQVAADTSGFYAGRDVTGTLRIADVELPQNLRLTDFSTPFTYRPGTVKVNPFEAACFGGRLTGDYTLDPSGPSLLNVNGERIDVAQVGQAANPGSSSRLQGQLALQSKWHGAETGKLTGEGDAQVSGGRIEGISVLNDLATALQVQELHDPELKSVTVHFEVANGETHFSNLDIESTVFAMTGDGVINAQGGLNADMVLTLHADAMGGIPGAALGFFSKLPTGGGSIPFHLSGTVGDPKADLSSRLLLSGSKVQKAVNHLFNHLFH
jgi:uncharacterized protein involved in outer membrane biogenesis